MSLQSSSWWLRGNRSNRSNTHKVQKNTSIFQKIIALAALTADDHWGESNVALSVSERQVDWLPLAREGRAPESMLSSTMDVRIL
jgi:hypothetical protein